MSGAHLGFLRECLRDLERALARRGVPLQVITGEAVEIFEALHAAEPFTDLWSHEESGTLATWDRDKAVQAWCKARSVTWHELPSGGVVRRLRDRDRWHGIWEARMAQPQVPVPALVSGGPLLRSDPPSEFRPAVLDAWDPPDRQRGGRTMAVPLLREFLESGGRGYRRGMSSPLSAPEACSRLSPYLAYGCLGMREVVQAVRRRRRQIRDGLGGSTRDLEAFESRLHWQAHFIQKFETEPSLSEATMHPEYEGLWDREAHPERFQALTAGRTGWPMVDACVTMLRQTGWINFRMRAMLVSTATGALWLDWRPVGLWLARLFVDYEPGIHWSQVQMQAGTTGINLPRIYNPVKQARDHDPEGVFVRRWLPAMREVPEPWLFEPWRVPDIIRSSETGGLPAPLVDLEAALREARSRIHAWRARPEVRAGKAEVIRKHASRAPRRPSARIRRKALAKERLVQPQAQLTLGLTEGVPEDATG